MPLHWHLPFPALALHPWASSAEGWGDTSSPAPPLLMDPEKPAGGFAAALWP